MAFSESEGILPVERRTTDDVEKIHDPWPPVTPSAPYSLINEKFDRTMVIADEMIEKLQGTDGNSGYLGTLNSLITAYSLPVTPDLTVTIDTSDPAYLVTSPAIDMTGVVTTFDPFDEADPILITVPTIDTSGLSLVEAPDSLVDGTIDWTEIPLSSDIYDALLARLLNDLDSGATGLDATVEQDIYARALDRQVVDNDKRTTEIDNLYSGSRWDLPSGAYVAAQAELAGDIARNNRDLNSKIMLEQAELAQKNSQFVITQAAGLEKMLRDSRDAESNRLLDKEKSKVQSAIQVYAENVRAYVAKMEANKVFIEAQLGALTGAVEYNKGVVDVFANKAKVYETVVGAQSKANESIIGVYEAGIKGYEAENKAQADRQSIIVENNKALISKADIELRAIIARIENSLQGYVSEMALRERVSNDMAQIASQSVASAFSSTSVSASMGYSGSEGRSENYSHSESVSQNDSFSSSTTENHSYSHEPT